MTDTKMVSIGQSLGPDKITEFAGQIDDFARLTKMIAASGLTRHNKAEAVGTLILAAKELNIPLVHALNGMYVVDGGLGMEGQLMLALAISRCGVTVEQTERSMDAYRGVIRREGWTPLPIEFTVDDAIRAGILRRYEEEGEVKVTATNPKKRHTWDSWRPDMLQWRAISAGLRVIAPDVFAFVYSMDEAMHMASAHTEGDGEASRELRQAVGVEIVDSEVVDDEPEPVTDDETRRLNELMDQARADDPTWEESDEFAVFLLALEQQDPVGVREAILILAERLGELGL